MPIESLINLILLFFAYAFLGWCIEVTLKYYQFHRFINRGFLTGPWLPIYGSGAALITVVIKGLAPLEFGNLILFGLGGVVIVDLINPLLLRLSEHMSFPLREIMALFLSVVFVADYVMSHFVLKLVKTSVELSEADDTEAISKEVRLLLSDRSVFHRRFAEAYPEVIYRTERIAARMEEIRAETERLRQEAEEHVAQMRQEVAENLEPTRSVKNEIIEKQDALIRLLYREEDASPEIRELKQEVESKKAVLQKRRARFPKL